MLNYKSRSWVFPSVGAFIEASSVIYDYDSSKALLFTIDTRVYRTKRRTPSLGLRRRRSFHPGKGVSVTESTVVRAA